MKSAKALPRYGSRRKDGKTDGGTTPISLRLWRGIMKANGFIPLNPKPLQASQLPVSQPSPVPAKSKPPVNSGIDQLVYTTRYGQAKNGHLMNCSVNTESLFYLYQCIRDR
ncbi:hypothetical protein DPMN_045095 [Dreissena polymorpha]|uniref:Uncharacterized protein n=1 Tax=Dreissena polymorpha TaxID=45954 RepID=A0A9D4I124_DREPO|nr:hypothetical protein DPMN_045095 [Dreissena polymorpha]